MARRVERDGPPRGVSAVLGPVPPPGHIERRRLQFVEDHLVDTDEASDAYAMTIDRALNEIAELRGTVEDLEQTVEKQADEIEQLREDREQALDELIDNLEEKLNGEYRALLKEDILDELDPDREYARLGPRPRRLTWCRCATSP